jgi:uncharacterized protein YbaP (TraB family)
MTQDYIRRLKRVAITLAFLHLAMVPGATAQQPATVVPQCSGRDIYEAMATENPTERRAIDAEGSRVPNGQNLLWRIEKSGIPPSTLFGTVHLTDDRVNALTPAITSALAASSSMALEVDNLSQASVARAIGNVRDLLMYHGGPSLLSNLTPEEIRLAETTVAKIGIAPEALRAVRPWVVTMTLALSDCERRRSASGLKPLDMRLAEMARLRGLPVTGLETIEDQIRAMARVPEDDQITVLKASLKLYDLTDDLIETTVRLYLARNIGTIWPLQAALWRQAGYSMEPFLSFQRELVTKRNITMRDAAVPLLDKGGVFIAVGALHLPGDEGLVKLLRHAGFSVTPVE